MDSLEKGIDLGHSALIVVDVQNDFCHSEGTAARMGLDVGAAQSIVPNIVTLIELARARGIPRIYLRGEHNRWFDSPTWLGRGASGRSIDARALPYVESGTWGADFFIVSPREDELVIVKHRYSGFAYTPLELALQTLGVDTVVLSGTATHVCVEATARDAIMRGYRPVIVKDCVASGQANLHEAALLDMAEYLGPVVSLEEVRHGWEAAYDLTESGVEAESAPRPV